MASQDKDPRWIRVSRPTGQALVVQVPNGISIDHAEKLARGLLSRQPSHRFIGPQEFVQTADRQLVIRGLGHDFLEIKRFSEKMNRTMKRAMAWQRFVQPMRREKRITLALVFLVALLVAINVWATDDKPVWALFDIGEIHTLHVDLNADGLLTFDESHLRRDIELLLRRKQVPMRSMQGVRLPALQVVVDMVTIRNAHATYRVKVELIVAVPTRIDGIDVPVPIWDRRWVGTANKASFSMHVRDFALESVDKFADDYLRANSQQVRDAVRSLQPALKSQPSDREMNHE